METARLLPHATIVRDWWLEVKDNFWEEDAKPHVKVLIKELMEKTLKAEIRSVLRTDWAQESAPYRNGYYRRGLTTQFGFIQDIRVPRLRTGSYKTRVFGRYKRHQAVVEDLVEDIFLKGVSTRKVGGCIQKLLDHRISASSVSRITRRLDAKVDQFHKRPLLDEYQYLILDGIVLKIKRGGKYHKRTVLVAYGITVFGKRELLGFRQSKGESQYAWEALLGSLYERGLKGENLKLLVMDGSAGLQLAKEVVYPRAKVQRCWVHKLRNVTDKVRKKDSPEVLKGAQNIYLAKNRRDAVRRFEDWNRRWRLIYPEAVRCLERDLEDLLSFFDCPQEHWIKVRTTNAIERSFREVRRRTRVFSCFTNTASSERMIFAIFHYLNAGWADKPLDGFTQFN